MADSKPGYLQILLLLALIQMLLILVSGGELWIASVIVVVVVLVVLTLQRVEHTMYCPRCQKDRKVRKVVRHQYYQIIEYNLDCGHKLMGSSKPR